MNVSTIHSCINQTIGRRERKRQRVFFFLSKRKAWVHRVMYLLRLQLYLHRWEHFIFELHNSLLQKGKETNSVCIDRKREDVHEEKPILHLFDLNIFVEKNLFNMCYAREYLITSLNSDLQRQLRIKMSLKWWVLSYIMWTSFFFSSRERISLSEFILT